MTRFLQLLRTIYQVLIKSSRQRFFNSSRESEMLDQSSFFLEQEQIQVHSLAFKLEILLNIGVSLHFLHFFIVSVWIALLSQKGSKRLALHLT